MYLPVDMVPGTPEIITLAVILTLVFGIDIYGALKRLWMRKIR